MQRNIHFWDMRMVRMVSDTTTRQSKLLRFRITIASRSLIPHHHHQTAHLRGRKGVKMTNLRLMIVTDKIKQMENERGQMKMRIYSTQPKISPVKEDLPNLENDSDDDESGILSTAHVYVAFSETDLDGRDPTMLKEVMKSPDWPEWEKAVQTELNTLKQMDTWKLVNAPKDRQPIMNKWVFMRKYDKDGNLQKYKARLVTRGFTQIPGMDYNETFSPVIWLEMIRAILALAVAQYWEIQQMDVKGAYLNGKLKEEIYMKQPDRFNDGTPQLCRLIKTLYGLKQSGHEWNEELDTKMNKIKFERLCSDPCVYV